jgi:Tfp pilus assembly protein PilO
LIVAQNYVHHLEASQAQAAELQDTVEHLQELLPQDEEPEEDLEEIQGMSGVEDVVRLSRIMCVPHSLSLFSLLCS